MASHRIFITGGLGNTLFQIAHMCAINKKHDVKIIKAIYQNTLLTKMLGWSVHSELIALNKLPEHKCKTMDFFVLILLFLKRKIYPNMDVSISFLDITWHFGYFQSDLDCDYSFIKKYISKYINFSPSYASLDPEHPDFLSLQNSCIIHIRKGDFPADTIIDNSYYLKIIKNLTSKFENFIFIGVEAETVLEYVKSNGINNVTLAQKKCEKYDYNLMFYCKNIVVSNSTFCFWPVFLGCKKTVYLTNTKAHWPFKTLYGNFKDVKLITIK